jgi:hypothetical protein
VGGEEGNLLAYPANPPSGMSGGIEETSASFEARTAPRSYPTIPGIRQDDELQSSELPLLGLLRSEIRLVRPRYCCVLSRVPLDVFGAGRSRLYLASQILRGWGFSNSRKLANGQLARLTNVARFPLRSKAAVIAAIAARRVLTQMRDQRATRAHGTAQSKSYSPEHCPIFWTCGERTMRSCPRFQAI